jgi:hypothetical protein
MLLPFAHPVNTGCAGQFDNSCKLLAAQSGESQNSEHKTPQRTSTTVLVAKLSSEELCFERFLRDRLDELDAVLREVCTLMLKAAR